MKTSKLFLLSAAALLALMSCGNNSSNGEKSAEQAVADSAAIAQKEQQLKDRLALLPEEPVFDIVTNMGTIKVKLYADTPLHRENFAKLALSGYYDKLLFHRVINGFMIQAGDPLSKDPENRAKFGTGGPDYTIPAEILPNHNHKKGALAAARKGDAANPFRESSGSQFYIVQNPETCAQLDGAYSVFGETLSGIDVIDKIAAVETDGRDCPVSDVKIITITLDENI